MIIIRGTIKDIDTNAEKPRLELTFDKEDYKRQNLPQGSKAPISLYLKGMNWKTKETFKEWFKRMKDIDSYLIDRKGNND